MENSPKGYAPGSLKLRSLTFQPTPSAAYQEAWHHVGTKHEPTPSRADLALSIKNEQKSERTHHITHQEAEQEPGHIAAAMPAQCHHIQAVIRRVFHVNQVIGHYRPFKERLSLKG